MYSYIVKELPAVVDATNKVNNPTIRSLSKKTGIFGHSMGGHGALMIALKNPECSHPFPHCSHLQSVEW